MASDIPTDPAQLLVHINRKLPFLEARKQDVENWVDIPTDPAQLLVHIRQYLPHLEAYKKALENWFDGLDNYSREWTPTITRAPTQENLHWGVL